MIKSSSLYFSRVILLLKLKIKTFRHTKAHLNGQLFSIIHTKKRQSYLCMLICMGYNSSQTSYKQSTFPLGFHMVIVTHIVTYVNVFSNNILRNSDVPTGLFKHHSVRNIVALFSYHIPLH